MLKRAEFGESLLEALNEGHNQTRLANWAYELYLDHANHLETGLYEEMMKIVSLEGGDEFWLTKAEIREIAEKLIRE